MDYLLMGLAATVIVAALMYFKYQAQQNKAIAKQKKRSGNGMGGFANCPVCGTMMLPGENLVTKVFTTSGQVNDQICYIYGCPHCFPVCEPGIKRSCPVCKKNVEQKQEEQPQGKLVAVSRRYYINQEFAILRQKDTKPYEFEEYNEFVEKCKQEAKNEINNGF